LVTVISIIMTIIMHMESARIESSVSCARERSVKTTW